MKYVFLGSLVIVCLGLFFGYPSADMLSHPNAPHSGLGGVVVLSSFICPVTGLLLLIRGYTRLLVRLHRRMSTDGLWHKGERS
ncbi:hypothetical protein [Acetobacter conturbans]|uniref:DUF2933 domain-containing protein n=1 Tax=Acetobacter conturbans TaxID=1737472 RepID=A0ABX0K403_9PROT|nr:hypothetical protein [Acetobacter conturbans]NHN89854.1 hypothetical protein [Acetobacter conturbans]